VKKKNILAVGAHPDDIEFGGGGALINYADQGHDVFLLVMTKGEQGGDDNIRYEEQSIALDILGAKDIFWGGIKDTHIFVNRDIILRIEEVIKQVKPNYIFCHFPDDTHQDHRHLAQMTTSATRYIRNVLFYEGPTTQRFDPNIYIDMSPKTLARKIAALQAHQSQALKTNIEGVSIVDIATSSATFRGIQGRVQYAEAFCGLRLFVEP